MTRIVHRCAICAINHVPLAVRRSRAAGSGTQEGDSMHYDPESTRIAFLANSANYFELDNAFRDQIVRDASAHWPLPMRRSEYRCEPAGFTLAPANASTLSN